MSLSNHCNRMVFAPLVALLASACGAIASDPFATLDGGDAGVSDGGSDGGPDGGLAGFAPVDLGSAAGFAVLGGTTVNALGASSVIGNVGSVGGSISGFPPSTVAGGTLLVNDPIALRAANDLIPALNDLAARPCDVALTGQDLGARTLGPGTFCFASPALLSGQLVLDGGNALDAQFIFQMQGGFTSANDSVIVLRNGARADRVFFQVGGDTILGPRSQIVGTIVALPSISLGPGVTLNGRVLSRNSVVSLDGSVVSLPVFP